MKTLKSFIEASNINESLIRAVVKQVGGWDTFKEMAQDVVNHGAVAGFSGFIYYNETGEFYASNRQALNEMASEMAKEFGQDSAAELVTGFRALNGDYSEDEVAQALYGPIDEAETAITNIMAWYALEEVSRAYVDSQEA